MNYLYNGNMVTVKEIRSLAIKYRLQFLKAKYYRGVISVEMAAEVREFGEITNSPVDTSSLEYNYYILAPKEMFDKEKQQSESNTNIAIFYCVDNHSFRLIGGENIKFSWIRRIKGYGWESELNHFIYAIVYCLPFATIGVSILAKIEIDMWLFIVLCIFASIVLAIISIIHIYWDNSTTEINRYFTINNWDNENSIK